VHGYAKHLLKLDLTRFHDCAYVLPALHVCLFRETLALTCARARHERAVS
jgi:hypothetical protein